jgi:uncharacterized repeat protein (TIGR02543 family)
MVNLPSEPTYPDHAFGGWYTEPYGNGTQFTATTPVTADMTVYAKWTPYLQVTFDAGPGTPAISTASCPAGATVGLPNDPTHLGYTFGGWYPEQNGNGTQFTAATPVTADMTVYAWWIREEEAVTVTFDAGPGTPAFSTASCPAGARVNLPSDPTHTYHTFGGWYTERNGNGTQFTAATLVTANTTVYAKWTPYPVVTFDAGAGGTPATSTASCPAGTVVSPPSINPRRAGYYFFGWYTEPNGNGTQFTATTPVNADMTVYAWWIREEEAVTVTFDAAGGTPGTSTVNCAHGESVGLPSPDPTHAYHTFGGWYTEPYGNGTEFTATTPVTANITVYAKWTPYPQVTFDAGPGTPAISTVLYPPGAMVNLPSEPTYPDHAFGGWYTEPNGNGMPFGTSIPVTEDMTVYAKWTPYLHVTFDADGGTPAISTASCPAGATVDLPSNPTRADYIFRGWYPEPNGGGTEFTATTLVTADMRVYAKWTYPQVTFDANGGTPATSTASCLAGATVLLPSDPTRTDYYFDGWYTAPNGGGTQFTAATPVNADTTVYAKWIREAEAVTVTFDANGGTPATSTVSCPAGARVNLPSDPTHTYHTFGGWYTEPNGNGTEFTATTLVTTNTTVYAKWTPYLQVTFDANGGTPAISTALCPAGVRVNLPSDPIYTEHTFGGWYTAPNGLGTQFTAATRVTANMTVYAKWTPYLQVTFDADGGTFANGETTSTASCPAGTTVVTVAMVALPSNPTRAGYAIDGWYTEPNGNGTQITATTLVNAGMTVYANWKPYLQVTFDTDGGEPITMTMTCLSGEYAGLPGNPTKAGHTFDGWYTEQNGNGTPFTAATRVNANMTVYAKWTPYLQVTFNADGGIFYEMAGFPATSTASCPAGTTVVLPSLNPTRASYDFFGWYTEQNGGGTQFTASTPVTEDMTVYAKWTPWPVVTFYAEGGEPETSTASCPVGTTVGVLPNSDRDGWSVGGWYTEPDGGGTEFTTSTPVTEDMTVYPTWVK